MLDVTPISLGMEEEINLTLGKPHSVNHQKRRKPLEKLRFFFNCNRGNIQYIYSMYFSCNLLIMNKMACIVLIVCFALGCAGQHHKMQKEDKEIISFLVDQLSYPNLPPPSLNSKDTLVSNAIIDSLSKSKLRIGIYPVMFNGMDSIGKNQLPNSYKNLVVTQPPEYRMITEINDVKSQKGHHIKLVDKTKIKDGSGYNSIDVLYRFSTIWYGKDKATAVVEVGTSRSRLDGNSTILCLEKQNGKWSVKEAIPTTIW